MTRVTIAVNNYNYAQFVHEAIDSALAQRWPDVQVVVVDDGSTDGSREALAAYAGRVHSVLKDNGGQASAFNAALPVCDGEVVIFLDADDVLAPHAAERCVEEFGDPRVVKASWPLLEVDRSGLETGRRIPSQPLPSGDLRPIVLEQGADSYLSPPSSGNAWSMRYLREVLPMPERDFRRGADGYLIVVAPLFGLVRAIGEPLGRYRLHGSNGFTSGGAHQRVTGALARHTVRTRAVAATVERLGMRASPEAWDQRNPYVAWLRATDDALTAVAAVVPVGQVFLLLDGGEWGIDALPGRRAVPLMQSAGFDGGPPADDDEAVAALQAHCTRGITTVVVTAAAFWWLEHYDALRRALDRWWTLVNASPHVRIYSRSPSDDEMR